LLWATRLDCVWREDKRCIVGVLCCVYSYVAICHPMNVQTTNTVRRARRVIVGLWLAGSIYSSPWLYLATTAPKDLSDGTTIWTCTYSLPRHMYLIYYMADLVIFYVVPLLTASVLYGLIARTLYSVTGPSRSSSGSIRSSMGAILGPGGMTGHRGSGGGFVGNPGTVSGAAARSRRSAFMRQQSSVSVASSHSNNSRLQVRGYFHPHPIPPPTPSPTSNSVLYLLDAVKSDLFSIVFVV
jgi:hypothetical protein